MERWRYNIGVVDAFADAVDLILQQEDGNPFKVTKPFWDKRRWVKFLHKEYRD